MTEVQKHYKRRHSDGDEAKVVKLHNAITYEYLHAGKPTRSTVISSDLKVKIGISPLHECNNTSGSHAPFAQSFRPIRLHPATHGRASTLTTPAFLLHTPTLNPRFSTPAFKMARKLNIKGVEAVGSKSMNTKRAAPDDQVRSSRKKLKTRPEPEAEIKSKPEGDQTKVESQNQVFRFLDLPGELRNRVYAYAEEYTHRCFPPLFSKEDPEPRSRNQVSSAPTRSSPTAPLPYSALTQVCTLIRSEFRPTWLSTHRVPLSAFDDYLRIYYPSIARNASPEAKRRLRTQYSPSGTMRIWIRNSELTDINILRLLKHAARFPDFTFSIIGGIDVSADILESIHALLNVKTPRWIQGVRNNKISAVRLLHKNEGSLLPRIQLVVKERYALPWMKSAFGYLGPMTGKYVWSLGLEKVAKTWTLRFAVDYS